ncbi:RING-H2 finger protein ATL66-like [Asparagus officinalis]|uniref:RING-H2 finger protein ATL66-like n=1 Tax=Asparagus officinalis TaxID=4686 RepID=UPI00098DEE35|nr:RING-H2 finger protein ATL66-like [Asparagus officinalis]
MFPDAETAPCSECAYPTTIFISGAVSVCILIFLLAFYRFLKNHCIRRDVNISQNNIARTETDGLAPEIIISLPAVQFKNNEHRNSECCSICLGVFEEGEWIRVLPNCAHAFHVSCVDIWLRSSSSCPLCRNNVLKDDGSSSSLPGSGTAIRAMETLPREEPTQGTACNPRVVELWVVSYG